jgi:DNA-binding MarR family transcriptional regulator
MEMKKMDAISAIGYLLQHISGVISKQNDQALQERLGIGFSQFKILRVLEQNPKTQQRQIAEWLGQTEASISRQIRLMMDKGLLQTSVNPENRREHLTTPTAKGSRLAEEAMEAMHIFHADAFKKLGEKKQQQLLESLAKMHQEVCQPGRVGACNHPFTI